MPEPKRLGEFSPEFVKSERELIGQVRTERKGELSDYIATERPQLKRPEGIPNELDLVRQVMAGRKKAVPVAPEGRTIGETLKDIPVTIAKGVVGLGEAVVGLADIPTLGRVGKTMEEYLGYDPQMTQRLLGEYYSPAQKAAFAKVEKAKGFVGTIKAAIKNPSTIGHSFIQTFPLMLGGAASARTLLGIGMKSPLLAGALGEGIISAGAAAEEARQQTKDGLLTPKQAALTAISGAGTAMFALAGGRVATKFGIIDPDVFLAGGSNVTSSGIIKRIAGGGISEGVFEELPQSMQEQVWLNAALDKPLLEGVSEAGATGMLTGMAMGAGFNVFTGKPYSPEDITPPTETAAKQERVEREAKKAEPAELTEAEKRQTAIDREFEARRTPAERQAEIEAAMPATPMTTISEETTKLAEEGIKPAPVEEVVEPTVVPPVEEIVEEPMPAAMRALGMRPKKPAVPFMITKETETKLADLGYTKEDIDRMPPEDALGIVEGRIAKEPVVEEKIVEPEIPKIEIPTLTDTTQAMAFGEKASPEQITELKRLRKESEKKYYVLVEEGKNDEAIEEAFRGQLYREAFEAKEKPKEPKVEKPKVAEKEIVPEKVEEKKLYKMTLAKIHKEPDVLMSSELRQLHDHKARTVGFEKAGTSFVEGYLKKLAEVAGETDMPAAMIVYEALSAYKKGNISQASLEAEKILGKLHKAERETLTPDKISEIHKKDIQRALKEGKPVPGEVLAEYPDLVPAKPPTPKPVEPKPPEAIREEIEVAPIPEVAPKVEKKEEPGFAWIKGKQKPILSAREIKSGKNKGKYEVVLTKGRDEEGNIIPGAKKIVTEKHIITMPEEKVEVAPIEKAKIVKPVIPGIKPVVEEKIEVTPTPEGKEITVDLTKKEEAAVTPKQQKAYLLTEIDKAIEEAPKVKPFESLVKEFQRESKWGISPAKRTELFEKQTRVAAERVAEYGTVTIHVPDDGVFTILNTKQSLDEFKKKAKKFPSIVPKAKKIIVPGVVRKVPVIETIDELRLTPDGKEYFTDGSVIIKGKPPAGVKYGKKEATQEYIKEILATETDPAELKYYAFHDPDFGHGVAKTPIPSGLATPNYSPMSVFQAKSGDLYGYNQFRLNAITKRFPKATYGMAEKEWQKGLLIAYENGKPVAALMPIGTKGENALMEDMATEKGFIEAKPIEKPVEEAKSRIKASTTEILKGERGSFSTKTKEGAATFEDFSIVGKDFIKRGADTFAKFTEQMKKTFGEVWEGVKHLAKKLYESAKRALRNERGLIGGIEAVGAPTGALSKAKDMLAVGKGKKEVWKKTGWLQGAEGAWKFEIDDSKVGVNYTIIEDKKAYALQTRLGKILIHPELFKAYPDLKNLTVSLRVEPGLETSGRFVAERFSDLEQVVPRSAIEIETSTKSKMKEALLHEIQHAIQSVEDFARGSAPQRLSTTETRWFFDGKTEDEFSWAFAMEIQEEFKKIKISVPGQERTIRFSKEKMLELQDRWSRIILTIEKKIPKLKRKTTIEQEKRRLELFKSALNEISKKDTWAVRTENSTFDRYLRHAGEIEAREAAIRAKLTPEQRRERIPYEAEGIPKEQWIITKGEGTSFSVEEVKTPVIKEVKKLTPAEKAAKAFKILGIKPKLKPEEPLPKRARSVGLAYQNISEEAKRLEAEMGLEYPKVTVTHKEIDEQADRIMRDQEQLIKTLAKEKNWSKEEGEVVRRAAVTGLESLMKVVASKDIEKANKMYKEFKKGIGNKLQNLHSEYGRNLESLKEMVSPMSIAKAFTGLERDLNKEDMDKFNSASEALGQGDAKPMINFQKHLKATKQDPQLMDYVYEYWYNSILSGVPTHVVNVASNTAWGAWQVGVHKPLLAAIDPLVAKFQKRPTEYYMAEIIPALAGIKRGFKPGIKGAKEMLLKGYTTNADLDKFAADMGKSVGAFQRSPNKYLKAIAPFLTMPTRALRGMDIWAKQMNYEAELGSIAKRMEKKGEGKYEELLKNPTANMMKEASRYADYTTFMEKLGKIGTMIEKLRTDVPGGRFIMPFVRTIANLVKRGVEMTPGVGAMKLLGGKVKGKEVTQVLVKQIEGAMIAMVVASMFDDDEITGDVPANKAEREAFYRQGKKPWSIKIGDTWYQYRRVEPFNTPIAAVGILHDTWKRTGEEPSTEFVYRAAAGFVNNIIDSSYLSGLTQVLDSVRKADKWPQKLTNMFDRTIASFSPMSSFQRSFVRAIEAIDKEGAVLRKPKGAIETLAAATPFISEMAPARKDVWGEEVVIPGSPLAQWLPWKAAKATKDVVEKEIERLHGLGLLAYPGMPAKYMSIAGKRLDLDDEQYDKLTMKGGQAAKKKLDSLVGTSYWKMLSDKEKATRIERIRTAATKKARSVIKRELGVGAIPGMVPWKTTKKKKRPAWQETALGKRSSGQKRIGF